MQKIILSLFSPVLVALLIRIIFWLIGGCLGATRYCFGLDKAQRGELSSELVEFNVFHSEMAIPYWFFVVIIIFLIEMSIWEDRRNNNTKNKFCAYDKALIYISSVISAFVIGFILYLLVGWLLYQTHSFVWKLIPHGFDTITPLCLLISKIIIYDTLPISIIWYLFFIHQNNDNFEQLGYPTFFLFCFGFLSLMTGFSTQDTFSFIHYIPSWVILLNASLFSLILGLIIVFYILQEEVFAHKSVSPNGIEKDSQEQNTKRPH